MTAPCGYISTVGRPPRWSGWVGICLLALCLQARADESQTKARNAAYALLQRAQDEPGRSLDDLPMVRAQIQAGLQQTRGDPLQYGLWLRPLWLYHLLLNEHIQARANLEEALEHLTKARAAPQLIAQFTSDLSYSFILLGEVAKAKEYLRRAIVIAGQHDKRLLADLYYSLADAYRKTGERMVARRYFEAAYEIDNALGNQSAASASELKLGVLARDAGNYGEAVQRHERALAYFRDAREYRELVAEIELARDHAAQRQFAVAEQFAQSARRDGRALVEQQIDAAIVLLRIHNDRRAANENVERNDALKLIAEIQTLLDRSSTPKRAALAQPTQRLQLAEQAIRHFARMRDIAKVVEYGSTAIELARNVANGLHVTKDDSLAWLSEAQPMFNEYVKALYMLDKEQVFPLLESYYGLQVTAAVRRAGIVGPAFEARAVELFERYRAAERALVDATSDVEKLRAYANASAQLTAASVRLEQRSHERDLARDAYLASYGAEPSRHLPQAAQPAAMGLPLLPAEDVLIRYFVQEEVSFAIVLAGKNIEYVDLPRRLEAQKLIQRALTVLQAPRASRGKGAELAALAALVPLKLIARHGKAARLIIVPDDAIQPLPFAAIDIAGPAEQYEPLGERYEIVRTKSASSYYAPEARQRERDERTADIVVFADPVIGSAAGGMQLRTVATRGWTDELSHLPSTRVEADSIARTFATRTVESYLGAEATSDVLLSPRVRAASILHIATHGYFNASTPEIVGLATSGAGRNAPGGGFLGLTELFNQRFSSRLVVISGCETMRGKEYNGWGVRSVADGFLTQGAGSVIGTLWSVSDEATAVLMDRFYRELYRTQGDSSAALRAAQRELIASARFSDPYYWAGVVLESSHRSLDQRAF